MNTRHFTPKQIDVLELLARHYPRACGIEDAEARAVFDSLVERGPVELVETDETPWGDAYKLTDSYAEALRDDAAERAEEARFN
jgi:hypothetical protein